MIIPFFWRSVQLWKYALQLRTDVSHARGLVKWQKGSWIRVSPFQERGDEIRPWQMCHFDRLIAIWRHWWVGTATPSQLPNFMYLIERGLCVPPCLHLPDKPESPIWSVFYSVCMLCQPNGGQALSRSITVRLFLWHYVHLPNNQSLLWNDPSVWGASLALPHDWNDTIKHQRSLLCFNGTFNKTDISSSQQQCLDIEERRGAGWGFPLPIGW